MDKGYGHFFRQNQKGGVTDGLISDRVNCSPEMMEMIKTDIAKVISKYMKIDAQSMEIQITKTSTKGLGKTPALYANIPILDLNK